MLSNIIDRIKLPFRKEKELYLALYKILGFFPRNITYYKIALMHKSLGHRATEKELKELEKVSAKKAKGKGKGAKKGKKLGRPLNNERLEFLGDAILDAVVGAVAYQHFPGKSEGFLTNARSKMVQRDTLGKLAQQMGLSRLIMASGRNVTHNSYIGGNAFEALVGAIYLDRGYEACRQFWTKRVMSEYLNVERVAYTEVNFKSKILEWSQKNRVKLDFRLVEQSQDENGSPKFAYTVVIEGIDGCTGEGFSKKESQQHACEMTLKELRTNGVFIDKIFAAKTERTQMEEMPVSVAPVVTETDDGLVIIKDIDDTTAGGGIITVAEREVDDLSLEDVDVRLQDKSREEIIAAAEAEAYGNS
ncbi:MAG: ribonuclease III [Prevotella sp.]|nr:ribonuclease III [Prevotella sp.]MBR1839716.1 ribonuclease III [Prevotella sp.]